MLALDSAICGQKCGVHGLNVNCSDARPKCDRDWRRCQGHSIRHRQFLPAHLHRFIKTTIAI